MIPLDEIIEKIKEATEGMTPVQKEVFCYLVAKEITKDYLSKPGIGRRIFLTEEVEE